MFHSCILHLANRHSWVEDPFKDVRGKKPYPTFKTYKKCNHPKRLSKRNYKGLKWLDMTSKAYDALYKLITNTKRSNAMKHCASFIHTGALEVYHNVRLKYLPKRTSYSLVRMVVMSMLVGIEINTNLKTKKVTKIYKKYSKVRGQWIDKKVTKGKDYGFRKELIADMIDNFVSKDPLPTIDLSEYIKKTIPKNIAPVPRPVTEIKAKSSQYTRF